jgi:hypothetical protein
MVRIEEETSTSISDQGKRETESTVHRAAKRRTADVVSLLSHSIIQFTSGEIQEQECTKSHNLPLTELRWLDKYHAVFVLPPLRIT